MNAMDKMGLKTINLIKSQGNLETFNLIIGFEHIPKNKVKDVKFYFKR